MVLLISKTNIYLKKYNHYIDSKEKGVAFEILASYKRFLTPHSDFVYL